jgi:hypothetical protein
MPLVSSGFPLKLALTCYAPAESGAIRSLEVHVAELENGALSLRYVLEGDLARIRIPALRPSRSADELWKHTCFEAFLRAGTSERYYELNVSPSTEWALYSFKEYRQGMSPTSAIAPPRIRVERPAQRLEVSVQMDARKLFAADDAAVSTASRRLALAAVVEDENGRLSYWALKHPASKPDFHHPDGFTLEL